jgi:two-component system, NtrC family, sensor kinase
MAVDLSALDYTTSGIFGVDPELRVVHWNTFMATHSGRAAEDVIGQPLFDCFPELPIAWLRWKFRTVFVLGGFAFSSWRQRPYVFRFPHNRPLTGGIDCMRQDATFLPIRSGGEVTAVYGVLSDATDAALAHDALERAHAALQAEVAERKRMETELRLAQKLEAVGRLASGIAHEINTPVQFVGDSVTFLQDAYRDLHGLVDTYRAVVHDLPADPAADAARARAAVAEEAADLGYLDTHVASAFARTEDGVHRVATLVRAMKEFGAPDQREQTYVDLNRAIETTLTIAGSEYRHVARVVTELGELPQVRCFGNEINQVFLNLIVNAAHAIADAHRGEAGEIRIRTWREPGALAIRVTDNGVGIPHEIRDRIFDLFFTTKEVGRGTGQGLAMVQSILTRHGATLTVDSEVGVGTSFEIRMPLDELSAPPP